MIEHSVRVNGITHVALTKVDVLEGMDVLQAMAVVETGYNEGLDAQDVPVKPVMLISVTVQE